MNAGKLPLHILHRLLDQVETSDPRVILGPVPGEDAALIDFGERYLVAKSDPITFATDLIGWYMVNVNANDIAVMGGSPRWLLTTLLLPEGTAEQQVADIFHQVLEACAELSVSLIGGHTEITYGLDRPIALGAMLGEVDRDRSVLSSGVRPGDAIVLTKGIALEGASILAREAPDLLGKSGVSDDVIQTARDLLFDPGISVVSDARIVRAASEVHAMHDPTEGGLSGGLYELSTASGLGFDIDADSIPVLPECRTICETLDLDPLGLIASGSLLAAVTPGDAAHVIDALQSEGIDAASIGYATDRHRRVLLTDAGHTDDFPRFDRDEIARFFASPHQGGTSTST